ncbi:hypothetical protein XU18_3947 [Perkinsela sp. CCAP 1560/4]|nr:hypothetical protein XU18_3947 [Perkinsela sp. CCAP 1560/4]|eukprot:KNH04889.1 hypothetical protein XU18_3947 [Perkinsela sp. CCAP 1560/4]
MSFSRVYLPRHQYHSVYYIKASRRYYLWKSKNGDGDTQTNALNQIRPDLVKCAVTRGYIAPRVASQVFYEKDRESLQDRSYQLRKPKEAPRSNVQNPVRSRIDHVTSSYRDESDLSEVGFAAYLSFIDPQTVRGLVRRTPEFSQFNEQSTQDIEPRVKVNKEALSSPPPRSYYCPNSFLTTQGRNSARASQGSHRFLCTMKEHINNPNLIRKLRPEFFHENLWSFSNSWLDSLAALLISLEAAGQSQGNCVESGILNQVRQAFCFLRHTENCHLTGKPVEAIHSRGSESRKRAIEALQRNLQLSPHSPVLLHRQSVYRSYTELRKRVYSSCQEKINDKVVSQSALTDSRPRLEAKSMQPMLRFPYLQHRFLGAIRKTQKSWPSEITLVSSPADDHNRKGVSSYFDHFCQSERAVRSCTKDADSGMIIEANFQNRICEFLFEKTPRLKEEGDSITRGSPSLRQESDSPTVKLTFPAELITELPPKEAGMKLDKDSKRLLEFFKEKIYMALRSLRLENTNDSAALTETTPRHHLPLRSPQDRSIPAQFFLPLGRWLVDDILVANESSRNVTFYSEDSCHEPCQRYLQTYQSLSTSALEGFRAYNYIYKPVFQILLDIFVQIQKAQPAVAELSVGVYNGRGETQRNTSNVPFITSETFVKSIFSVEKVEVLVNRTVFELENAMRHCEPAKERLEAASALNLDGHVYSSQSDEHGECVLLSDNDISTSERHSLQVRKEKNEARSMWLESIQAFCSLESFFGVFGIPSLRQAVYSTTSLSRLIFLLTIEHLRTSQKAERADVRHLVDCEDEVVRTIFEDHSKESNISHHAIAETVMQLYYRSNRFAKLLSRTALLCCLYFLASRGKKEISDLYGQCFPDIATRHRHYESVTKFLLRQGCFSWKAGIRLVTSIDHSIEARRIQNDSTHVCADRESDNQANAMEWKMILASSSSWQLSMETLSYLWRNQPSLRSWKLCLSVLTSSRANCALPEFQSMKLIWKITRYCADIPRFARKQIASIMINRRLWEHAFVISQSKKTLTDTHWILQSIFRQRHRARPGSFFGEGKSALNRFKHHELENDLLQFVLQKVTTLRERKETKSCLWYEALTILHRWGQSRKMWPQSRPPLYLSPYSSALLFCIPGVPKWILDTLVFPESLFDDIRLDPLLVSRLNDNQIIGLLGKTKTESGDCFLLTKFLSLGAHWRVAVDVWLQNHDARRHGHLVDLLYRKRLLRAALSAFPKAHDWGSALKQSTMPISGTAEHFLSRSAPLTTVSIHYIIRSITLPQSIAVGYSESHSVRGLLKQLMKRLRISQFMHSLLAHSPRGLKLFGAYFVFLRNFCHWDSHDFLVTFMRQESLRGKMLTSPERPLASGKSFAHLIVANAKPCHPAFRTRDPLPWYGIQNTNPIILEQDSSFVDSEENEETINTNEIDEGESVSDATALSEMSIRGPGGPAAENQVPTLAFNPSWEVVMSHFSAFVQLRANPQAGHAQETHCMLDNFARGQTSTAESYRGNSTTRGGPAYYMLVLKSLMSTRFQCKFHAGVGASITPVWWWWYMVQIGSPQTALPRDYCNQVLQLLWHATQSEARLIMWSVKKSLVKIPQTEMKVLNELSIWQGLEDLILAPSSNSHSRSSGIPGQFSGAKSDFKQKSHREAVDFRVSSIFGLNFHVQAIMESRKNYASRVIRTGDKKSQKGPEKHCTDNPSHILLSRHKQGDKTNAKRVTSSWQTAVTAFLAWTKAQSWEWEHEFLHSDLEGELSISQKCASGNMFDLSEPLRCPFTTSHSTIFNCYGSFPLGMARHTQQSMIADPLSRVKQLSDAASWAHLRVFSYELPCLLSNFICSQTDAQTVCRVLFGILRADISAFSCGEDAGASLQAHKVLDELRSISQGLGHVAFRLQLAPRLRISAILRVTRYLFSLGEDSIDLFLGKPTHKPSSRFPQRTSEESRVCRPEDRRDRQRLQYPSMMYIAHEGLRIQATAEYYLQTCMNHREWVRIVFRNCRAHPALSARLVQFLIDEESVINMGSRSLPSAVFQAVWIEYEALTQKSSSSHVPPALSFLQIDYLTPLIASTSALPRRVLTLLRTFVILARVNCLYVDLVAPAVRFLQRMQFGVTALRLLARSITTTYHLSETWLASNLEEEHKSLPANLSLPSLGAIEGVNLRPLLDFRAPIIKCLRRSPLHTVDWRIALLCVMGMRPIDMIASTKHCWTTAIHVLTRLVQHYHAGTLFLFPTGRTGRNVDRRESQRGILRKQTQRYALTRCFLTGLVLTYVARKWSITKSIVLFMAGEGLFDSRGIVARFARRVSLSGNKLFNLVRGLCSKTANQWPHAIAVCLENFKQCHVATILHPLENASVPWYIGLGLMSLALANGTNRRFVVRSHYIDLLHKSLLRSAHATAKAALIARIHPAWVTDVIPHRELLSDFPHPILFPPVDESTAVKISTDTEEHVVWPIRYSTASPWVVGLEKYAAYKSNRPPFNERFFLALFRCFNDRRPDIVVKLYHACWHDIHSRETLAIALHNSITEGKWLSCLRVTLNHGKSLGQFIKGTLRNQALHTIIGSCPDAVAFQAALFSKGRGPLAEKGTTILDASHLLHDEWKAILKKCAQFSRWEHLLQLVSAHSDPSVIQRMRTEDGQLREHFIEAMTLASPRHLHSFATTENDFLVAAKVFFHKYGLLLRSVQSFYNCAHASKHQEGPNVQTLSHILKHPLNRDLLIFLGSLARHLTTIAILHPLTTASEKVWVKLVDFIRQSIPHGILVHFCWNPYKHREKERLSGGVQERDLNSSIDSMDEDIDDYAHVNNATFFSSLLKECRIPLWLPLQKCIQWCTSSSSTVIALRVVFTSLTACEPQTSSISETSPETGGGSISEIGFSRFLVRSLFSEILHWRATRHCRASWSGALSILRESLSLWFIARRQSLVQKNMPHLDAGGCSELHEDCLVRTPAAAERVIRISHLASETHSISAVENQRDIDAFFANKRLQVDDRQYSVDKELKDEIYSACTLLLRLTTSTPEDAPKNKMEADADRSDFQKMLFPMQPNIARRTANTPSGPEKATQWKTSTWLAALAILYSVPHHNATKDKSHSVSYYHEPIEGIFCQYRLFHDFYGRLCYIIARYAPQNWDNVLRICSLSRVRDPEDKKRHQLAFTFSGISLQSTFEERRFHVSLANTTNITGVLNILRRNQLWRESLALFSSYHSASFTASPFTVPPFLNLPRVSTNMHEIARTSRPLLRCLFDLPDWRMSIFVLNAYVYPMVRQELNSLAIKHESNQSEQDIEFPLKLVLSLYRYVTKGCSLKGVWVAAVHTFTQGVHVYNLFLKTLRFVSHAPSHSIGRKNSPRHSHSTTDIQRLFGTSFADIADALNRQNDTTHWVLALQLLSRFHQLVEFQKPPKGTRYHAELVRMQTFMSGSIFELGLPWEIGLRVFQSLLWSLRHEDNALGEIGAAHCRSYLLTKAIITFVRSSVQRTHVKSREYAPSIESLCKALDWRKREIASRPVDKSNNLECLYSSVRFSNAKLHFYMAHYYNSQTELERLSDPSLMHALYIFHMGRFYSFFERRTGG